MNIIQCKINRQKLPACVLSLFLLLYLSSFLFDIDEGRDEDEEGAGRGAAGHGGA